MESRKVTLTRRETVTEDWQGTGSDIGLKRGEPPIQQEKFSDKVRLLI